MEQQYVKNNDSQTEQIEELRAALVEAERANQAKSTFLSSMAHDIRTPLNVIIGFTQLACEYKDDPKKVEEYHKKILASSNHLLDLINDVLDISKIESGKVSLNISEFSVSDMIENVEASIRSQTEERAQNFQIELRDVRHNYLMGDKLRMDQVLLNLLSNAVKYTPIGGEISLQVEQKHCIDSNMVTFCITVEDNGSGMSEEFQKILFEPFTRETTGVAGKVQGTGLGMTITKNLIELMGGTIRVESRQREGSRFFVEIPLSIAEHGQEQQDNRESFYKLKQESILRGMHILVAEDNDLNAEILSELLGVVGATCEVVFDGQQLVEHFEASVPGKYDLILMDIEMPVMDGYEATRRIRNSSHLMSQGIPIIAMTANAFQEDIYKALEAGMDAHVAKPIDMMVLERTVVSVMGGRRRKQA